MQKIVFNNGHYTNICIPNMIEHELIEFMMGIMHVQVVTSAIKKPEFCSKRKLATWFSVPFMDALFVPLADAVGASVDQIKVSHSVF
jgi:hypothetical protein